MTSTREKVAREIRQMMFETSNFPTSDEIATAATNAFLKAAAEQGWHMRPDEATEEMIIAGGNHHHIGDGYEAMHNAADEYAWDK